jgi:pimeloyl-ACP methyl ester carboxylesterase
MGHRPGLAAVVALAALLLAAAPAAAAPPPPFGHACAPKADGVLTCPTADLASRVPSFDGVPLDVDVTLPATGDGPFPTVVMLHGLGGNKTNFQAPTAAGTDARTRGYNDVALARAGFAVVLPSARGFGASCGRPESRTAGCERGWQHLADHRYEARDVQHLLGLLVDQGVARPDALGVTGESYGGGTSLSLAGLRDRIRLPDGSFAPWRSPAGRPLAIAAAWPRWPWSDLAAALVPNRRADTTNPAGVPLGSILDLLYAVSAANFLSPPGADPSSDLTTWRRLIERGERGERARRILRELRGFHSAAGVSGTPAPTLVQSGWTDDLFPANEGIRALERAPRRVALQLGDLGHFRAANRPALYDDFNAQGLAFLRQHLAGGPVAVRAGSVRARVQACPRTAGDGPSIEASSLTGLAPRTVTLRARRDADRGTVRSTSGTTFGREVDPARSRVCDSVRARIEPGSYTIVTPVRRAFTLLGVPRLRLRVEAPAQLSQLAVRVWERRGGRQRLVTRGVLRLRPRERGTVEADLNGAGWRFRPGSEIVVALLGRDAPFLRRDPGRARSVRVSGVRVTLPVR